MMQLAVPQQESVVPWERFEQAKLCLVRRQGIKQITVTPNLSICAVPVEVYSFASLGNLRRFTELAKR